MATSGRRTRSSPESKRTRPAPKPKDFEPAADAIIALATNPPEEVVEKLNALTPDEVRREVEDVEGEHVRPARKKRAQTRRRPRAASE